MDGPTQQEGNSNRRLDKISMFQRTRKMFTRAAKSFVVLHRLDYKEAFSCKCDVGEHPPPSFCVYNMFSTTNLYLTSFPSGPSLLLQSGTPQAIQLDGTYLSILKRRFHISTPHLMRAENVRDCDKVGGRGMIANNSIFP